MKHLYSFFHTHSVAETCICHGAGFTHTCATLSISAIVFNSMVQQQAWCLGILPDDPAAQIHRYNTMLQSGWTSHLAYLVSSPLFCRMLVLKDCRDCTVSVPPQHRNCWAHKPAGPRSGRAWKRSIEGESPVVDKDVVRED